MRSPGGVGAARYNDAMPASASRPDDREPLVVLRSASFARPTGEPALLDVTWTLGEGETWAVVGPVGAGKTALAEVLLGKHRLTGGEIGWPLLERLRAAGRALGWPS